MKIHLLVLTLLVGLFSCSTLRTSKNTTPLTQTEATQGIKEALDQGVSNGIAQLNRENGFFGNGAYKILLPPDAQKIDTTLRKLGMSALVDRAIMQINRAAEDAIGAARPIFRDAISQMTVPDALNIIKGSKDAATQYFRDKTSDKLMAAFTPVIKNSLDRFSATKYYGDMITTYNGFPTTINKLNPDLTNYVVGKSIEALFDQIAREEANIRDNPRARTTAILKRAFGG